MRLTRRAIVPLTVLAAAALMLLAFWPRADVKYARMPIELYPSSAPEELARLDSVSAGQRVSVLERHSPWARVRAGENEGWLPEWYLTDDAAAKPENVEQYRLIVKDPCYAYLYPDAAAPAVRELTVGKVVTVRAESGDWRYVDIIVFDIPAVSRGWVRAKDLTTGDAVTAGEGRLPAGTKIHQGEPTAIAPQSLPADITQYELVISISHQRGDMAYVMAAGGWYAWVAKSDIIFDVTGK